MSTYEYRAIHSSWGIAIDVTATAHRVFAPPSTAERVADDLYLEIAPEVRLDDGERRLLASGLRPRGRRRAGSCGAGWKWSCRRR
jgi:hypothetical protein